jgi:predicted PolB exonuclease-like 3'-5' exonuclease
MPSPGEDITAGDINILPAGETAPAPEPGKDPAPSRKPRPQDERWLLCLSVKTVPERDLIPKEWDQSRMPKPMYHKIVAIGILRAQIFGDGPGQEKLIVAECRTGGKPGLDEAGMITGFWKAFEAWRPRLVTFNGRGFALPVIQYRSMRHGLSSKFFHAGDGKNSYTSRYAAHFHADIMDLLSDFGASERPALTDIARGLSLPARPEGMAEPEALVKEGKIEEVRSMAEADAATIFLSYIRWRLFTGAMSAESHAEAAGSLRAKLLERGPANGQAVAGLLAYWQREAATKQKSDPG